MVGIRDFFDAFKGAGGGPTEPGHWRNYERFGRMQGTGAAEGDFELPEGEVLLCSEDYAQVERLEVELTGPDSTPIELERYGPENRDSDRGAVNLFWIGKGAVSSPGTHRASVRAPDQQQPLIVVVGRAMTAKEMMLGGLTGKGGILERG